MSRNGTCYLRPSFQEGNSTWSWVLTPNSVRRNGCHKSALLPMDWDSTFHESNSFAKQTHVKPCPAAGLPNPNRHFPVSARVVTCEVLKDERYCKKKFCVFRAQRRLINKWVFMSVLEHCMASGKYMLLFRAKQRRSSFGLWMEMGLERKQTLSLKWKWKRKQCKEPCAWLPSESSTGKGRESS